MIKKGAQVEVICGKDKGKKGEVITILRSEDKAKVKGINIIKKHEKTTKEKKETRKMNMQHKVNHLLDKINKVGYDNLTEEEKEDLYFHSRHLGKDLEKD